jgi:hypothetical protein
MKRILATAAAAAETVAAAFETIGELFGWLPQDLCIYTQMS